MLHQFLSFINNNNLVEEQDTILVACSGGIDSMVLIDLLLEAKIPIGVAHLNHNLRGEDAIKDEEFVQSFCEKHQIPFHLKSLPIAKMTQTEKTNMHQLARRERYQFFKTILKEHNYSKIATAHHADDKIEGFFLNLLRGSGINGLSGMKNDRDWLIRPLLFAYKDGIKFYARKNNIIYREDSSNASTKYSRNFIRHEIMPSLEKFKPSYQQTISQSIELLNDSRSLLNHYIESNKDQYIQFEEHQVLIDLTAMTSIPGKNTLLFELIKAYSFTSSQIHSINKAIQHTGAQFKSNSHEAIIDRGQLIIRSIQQTDNLTYQLSLDDDVNIPSLGHISCCNNDANIIKLNQHLALLDASTLTFPLFIRKWMPGDKFQPQGMKGKYKKVKKYLTDIKLNRFEKDNTFVLISDEQICWLIGHRIDERFKGTDLKLELKVDETEK